MHVLVSNSFLSTLWTQLVAIPETDWRSVKLCTFQFLIFWCQISELSICCNPGNWLKISKAMHMSVSDFLVSNLWTLNLFVIRKLIDDHKEMSMKIMPKSAESHWRSRKNISLQQSFFKSLNSQFVVILETLWRQEKNVCRTMHVNLLWSGKLMKIKKKVCKNYSHFSLHQSFLKIFEPSICF
jgi:hypothetical protein